ncbi:MAG TPA: YceH family protein [Casimicrobiaceae bacterium]|jgi:hypothetical protein
MESPLAGVKRNAPPTLSLIETRVLGVLVEKQHTVPDTYPLTLNALVAGCNQRTSRDPVIEASESEVQSALDTLKAHALIVESSGSRVMRYAHNVERALAIPVQSVALLATLMLRGPQTAGELRINGERLHRFADISAVEGFLHELAARSAGALVVELPRSAGTRETRWTHLLAGSYEPSVASTGASPAAETVSQPDAVTLQQAMSALRADVDALKETVAALCAKLGVRPRGPDR